MNWFSFLLDECSNFDWILLTSELSLEDVTASYKRFISEDEEEIAQLYAEIGEIEDNLEKLNNQETFANLDIDKKWAVLFRSKNIVHLKKIVSALLSIFPSNAFCETIFSRISALWTDEKNSFSVETINAFLFVKCNFGLDVVAANEYFLVQTELLNCAKSVEKYGFS